MAEYHTMLVKQGFMAQLYRIVTYYYTCNSCGEGEAPDTTKTHKYFRFTYVKDMFTLHLLTM